MGRFARQLQRLQTLHAQEPHYKRQRCEPERRDPEQEGRRDKPRIDALREELAKALGRGTPRRPRIDVDFEECLDLERIDTVHGPLSRRRLRYADSDAIGSARFGAAVWADPEVLAALSLCQDLAVDPKTAIFVDTETTGLGGGTGNYAFLVGLAYREGDSWVMEQLMLRDPDDEPAMLAYVRQFIARAGMVVSYNGKSFDMPLLRARHVMCRQPELPARPHLDLLHVARRVHAARSFRKSLTSIEREVLGFERHGDVAGEEVAQRYLDYARYGDPRPLGAVLDHNAFDVMTLVALVGIYGQPLGCSQPTLDGEELACIARTMKRFGDLDRAAYVADIAVARGACAISRYVRAEISKARGDAASAARDFESVTDDPRARLELAKLYEHKLRALPAALAITERGTGECPQMQQRRLDRLRDKLARIPGPAGLG